jgi:hypothetical protein
MSGTGTGTYTGSSGSGTGAAVEKTFLDRVLDDLAVYFDVTGGFAQNAVYTPDGGVATTIPVIFDNIEVPELGMESAQIGCLAKTSDVSAAKPKDTIVIAGTTYKIKEPPAHSADGISEIDLSID